jgi:hypothetical protein
VKTSKLAALLAMTIALGIGSPMFAAESTGSEGGLETAVDGSLMVTRAGGVGAALVVGTPVAIVRDSYKYYTDWTPSLADHVGGKDFGPSMALVSLVTLPAAMTWGTVTGTFHGVRNGFTEGFQEPFNAKSFNITKDYEE